MSLLEVNGAEYTLLKAKQNDTEHTENISLFKNCMLVYAYVPAIHAFQSELTHLSMVNMTKYAKKAFLGFVLQHISPSTSFHYVITNLLLNTICFQF